MTAKDERLAIFTILNIQETYVVNLRFDPEHRIYFAYDSEVPGLHMEAATIDELLEIAKDAAPDLLGEKATDAYLEFYIV